MLAMKKDIKMTTLKDLQGIWAVHKFIQLVLSSLCLNVHQWQFGRKVKGHDNNLL